MDDELIGFDEPKRSVGRPRGSKNRDAVSIETEQKINSMYRRMMPFLTREQKAYAQDIMDGKAGVDALMELELIIRQTSFVFSEAADDHWKGRKITRELSELINALRMSLKDFEDIKRARDEKAEKVQQVDTVQIEDREKTRQRIEQIVGRYAEKHEDSG